MTFNHNNFGSNPGGPKNLNGYHLMVGCLSSKQSVSVRFRLAVYSLVLYINKEYIIIVEKPPDPRCAYYGCEARRQLAWLATQPYF